MKKNYQKPAMRVVKIQHQQHLLQASVNNVNSSSIGIGFGGGSSVSGRARQNNDDWDDWDE